MLTQPKRRHISVTALALAAFIAPPAFAIVRTTQMNGAACLPDDHNQAYERNAGGYTALSSGQAHCPVFIDETTRDIEDAIVFVDLPPGTTATCVLSVVSRTGTVIDSDTETTSNDAPGTNMNFVRVGVGGNEDASVSLRCTLPENGRIIGYLIEEGN